MVRRRSARGRRRRGATPRCGREHPSLVEVRALSLGRWPRRGVASRRRRRALLPGAPKAQVFEPGARRARKRDEAGTRYARLVPGLEDMLRARVALEAHGEQL